MAGRSVRLTTADFQMEGSVIDEQLDRLSELPHSLILRILSLLPMRDVVSTAFLSKYWNKLWTSVPCLNFREDSGAERARNFVNRALMLWKGSKILKFEIHIWSFFDMSLAGDVNLWVRFAVENEVEELNIDLRYKEDELEWEGEVLSMNDVYRAPQCLYSCSSIKKLSLVGCNLRIHGFPAWNQLESLRIDGFFFSERLINRILMGSPQLEVFELRLLESFENLNIRSTSLKKLKVEKYLMFEDNDSSPDAVLRICCPKLEKLELSGVLFRMCLFTDVSSLTDATFGCQDMCGNEFLGETLKEILPTIQHVERLGLSDVSAEELGASHTKATLSPLPNVKFLKLILTSFELFEVEFRDAMNLLGIFPNLKTLVIEDEAMSIYVNPPPFDLEFETNLSKSFLMQLKTIQITSQFDNTSIFQIIEFLLKYATTLEKLVIQPEYGMSYSHATFSRAAKKLLSMPRSSPTAKVIFSTN